MWLLWEWNGINSGFLGILFSHYPAAGSQEDSPSKTMSLPATSALILNSFEIPVMSGCYLYSLGQQRLAALPSLMPTRIFAICRRCAIGRWQKNMFQLYVFHFFYINIRFKVYWENTAVHIESHEIIPFTAGCNRARRTPHRKYAVYELYQLFEISTSAGCAVASPSRSITADVSLWGDLSS